ncbi:MAG TPA: flagellar basal-body MS-ring/collar protein FliF [Polyangiaceae bacterium]
MPDRFRSALSQLGTFWKNLPTAKRIALVTLTAAVLVAVGLVAVLGNRERFAYLYTDLSTEDAAAIVEKLKTQQIPHQLEGGGTAILVPEERVAALRLELAGGGLPRGGRVGFEIFDQARIGATEFEQQVNLRRALEGELSRSVMTIEGVKSARVHLVLPERRLFTTRSESASASVVVRLGNSAAFGRREVAAVVHLVSAAVPGLSKDRVSVVSTEGVTLHRPLSDAAGAADLTDLHGEQARLIASQYEKDVLGQLERVVGPGNADVRINLDLDSSRREKTEELYEPSKTALRSEHKVEELSGADEAGVAGVPGARTNLPDAEGEPAVGAAPAGAGGGVRRSHTRNWEVEKVTQKTSTPPGQIKRLSVAVLLNGRWEQRGDKSVFVARSPEEVKSLEEIVKRAVGFDAVRGDNVLVQAAKFSRIEEPPLPVEPKWLVATRQWGPTALGAIALLGAASVVLVWRRRESKKQALALAARPVTLGELAPGEAAPMALPGGSAELAAIQQATFEQTRQEALQLAAKDPATAAVVLRQWLAPDAAVAALPK